MAYKDEIRRLVSKRREEALDATFHLFSKSTIEEVSMVDIAKAADIGVASLYRYFGTKLRLVIELAALKWQEYAEKMETAYAAKNGSEMNASEEFEFYLDCYIDLYEHHKPLLRFNSNFDQYIIHKNATEEEMRCYYESVSCFAKKFSVVYQKALQDQTMRTDILEQELYFSVMYTMLSTAQKFAHGLIYPNDQSLIHTKVLQTQKQMFLSYVERMP